MAPIQTNVTIQLSWAIKKEEGRPGETQVRSSWELGYHGTINIYKLGSKVFSNFSGSTLLFLTLFLLLVAFKGVSSHLINSQENGGRGAGAAPLRQLRGRAPQWEAEAGN